MVEPAPPAWQVWTALGLVYVVWGSTYLAIRYVVETVPSFLGAGLRFLCAALLLTAYLAIRRGRVAFRATRRQVLGAAGVGLLLLLGGNGGVTLAEQRHLPSGLTALVVAGVPLYVVVFRAVAHDRPGRGTLLGVAIGFLGLAVLLLPGSRPAGVSAGPALLVVGSSFLWAVGSFVASRIDLPKDPLWTTTVQMVGGGLGLLLAAAAHGESWQPGRVSLVSAVNLAYLVVFGSIVAFTSYSWLLRVAPVSKVATYAYVNPVVAVLLGALVAGEKVGLTAVVGGAVTVLAVAVVVSGEGRRQPSVPVDAPLVSGDQAGDDQAPDDRQARDRSSST